MLRLVRFLAIAAAVIWSLLAWGLYGLVNWVGGLAARNADLATSNPEAVEWLFWGAGLLTSFGLTGVVVTWIIGLAVLGMIVLFAGRRRPSALPRDMSRQDGLTSLGAPPDWTRRKKCYNVTL